MLNIEKRNSIRVSHITTNEITCLLSTIIQLQFRKQIFRVVNLLLEDVQLALGLSARKMELANGVQILV